MREAAGRDDRHIGRLRAHGSGVCPLVEAERDPARLALGNAPVDDADHLASARALCGQAYLPAGLARALEYDDLVPPFRRDSRGFEARRTRADNDDLASDVGLGDLMRHRLFAARGGIVDAKGGAALIDPVEAVIGADARPDVALATLDDFPDYVRICHMRARHSDHVELAGRDRMTRGRDIGNARGVKGRKFGRGANLAGEIEMRRARHPLDRDDVGEPCVGVDMAADDVEKVDQAAFLEPSRNLESVRARQAARQRFVGDEADADQKVRPDAIANGGENFEREAKPVVERAAIWRLHIVGQGRPELVHQMAVGLELEAVESARFQPVGRVGIVLDDSLDVPILDFLGKGAMGGFALVRGRQRGEPVAEVPARAPAEMGELHHHGGAVLVTGVGEVPQPRHDLVLIGEYVVESRRAVARHRR